MTAQIISLPADPTAIAAPACSLSPDSMRERGRDWEALRDRYLLERVRSQRATTSRWRVEGFAALRTLVEAERECCPFLAFTLTVREGSIELETTFPDGVSSDLFPEVG